MLAFPRLCATKPPRRSLGYGTRAIDQPNGADDLRNGVTNRGWAPCAAAKIMCRGFVWAVPCGVRFGVRGFVWAVPRGDPRRGGSPGGAYRNLMRKTLLGFIGI